MLRLLVICAAVISLSTGSLIALAQQRPAGQPRQLAPGVLTVIPPTIEEEETFSGPREFVGLTNNGDLRDWVPNFEPTSNTLREMAAVSVFRRNVWQVEFAFKPLRMIEVDVPQPNGLLQRKLIWYMVFRVRNTGNHLSPAPGEWQRNAQGELVTSNESAAIDPETGQAIILQNRPAFEIDDAPEGSSSQETPHGIRRVDFKVRCFPFFVLRSHEFNKEYLDRLIPTAIPAIQEREDPNTPLLNTAQIGQQWLEVSRDQDQGLWGVATWEDIDPELDFFSIDVGGLSNAYRWQEAGEGEPPAEEFTYEQKTLQINFWRPGDGVHEHENEILLGMPPSTFRGSGVSPLELYGVERRLDYLWIYR